jgi:hypothetical protein
VRTVGGVSSDFPNDHFGWDGSAWVAKTAPPASPTYGTNVLLLSPCAETFDGEYYLNQPWGFGAHGGADVSLRYDAATDAWTTRAGASYPSAITSGGPTAALAGDKNGMGWTATLTLSYEVCKEYDTATDTWTTKNAPLSISPGSSECLGSYLDGNFYLLGNVPFNTEGASVHEFDTAGDSWTTKTYQTYQRYASGHWTDRVSGQIYVTGGNEGATIYGQAEVYLASTDAWSAVTSQPVNTTEQAGVQAGSGNGALLGGSTFPGLLGRTNRHVHGLAGLGVITWSSRVVLGSSRLTTGGNG